MKRYIKWLSLIFILNSFLACESETIAHQPLEMNPSDDNSNDNNPQKDNVNETALDWQDFVGCGDGSVTGSEQCDDGGYLNGDGCSTECKIEDGFKCSASGKECFDIDECIVDSPCNGNAVCTNNPGSFICECQLGFHGDGFECVENICEQSCHNRGYCADTAQDSTECRCKPGFEGDGVNSCTDINECYIDNGGCDDFCENQFGNFNCYCPAGYLLKEDGFGCKDINECSLGYCANQGRCNNTQGSYTCYYAHTEIPLDTDGFEYKPN